MLKRISLKYALIIVSVITAITLIFIPIYTTMQKSLFIDREKAKMESFCESLIENADFSDPDMIADYIEECNESNYSITIRDKEDTIIFSTNRRPNQRNNENRLPGDNGLPEEQYTVHSPPVFHEDEGHNHEAITLRRLHSTDTSEPHYIFIKEELRNIESLFEFTNHILAGIIIAYIIVCVIIIILLMGGITKSIRKLTEAVIKISKKDYSVRYERKISSDEIGVLATNFNNMADTIQNNINSINNYNFILKEDNEHLRESDRLRQTFVRNATHEFKTPLAIISGQVEMMYCTDDKEKKEYYYNSILQEIQKMSHLITSLLNDPEYIRSRATAAYRIDLSGIIKNLCSSYNGIMLTKKIVFKTDIEENCYTMMTSSNVEHIFNNYIINAVRHTSPKAVISVTLKEKSGFYRLSVYNDGENISEDNIDKIWNEFYSVSDHSTESDSSGLGLFIVREISYIYQTDCGVINRSHGIEFWFDFKILG